MYPDPRRLENGRTDLALLGSDVYFLKQWRIGERVTCVGLQREEFLAREISALARGGASRTLSSLGMPRASRDSPMQALSAL